MTPFSFSMGPVDPSVENPRKNTDSHTVNSLLMDTSIRWTLRQKGPILELAFALLYSL